MHVLITGGAGFIGYHLASYHMERDDRVVLLDNLFKTGGRADQPFQALTGKKQIEYIQADLTRPLSLDVGSDPFDIVYHLAAINGTQLFYDIPYELARANVLMTVNLLDWLQDRTVRTFVYASTSEVYAGAAAVGALSIPTDEATPVVFPQPTPVRFSYGTSKFIGEFLCTEFGKKHKVRTSVIRYHNIYGPRMGSRHVIPELIARIRGGERPLRVYGAKETRAFCYVEDAVAATYLVATTPACDEETIHVGNSQEEIAIEALAKLIMAELGVSAEILECEGRPGSVMRRCPDTSKLKRLTGFEAKVALKDGLSRTCRWYLNHSGA